MYKQCGTNPVVPRPTNGVARRTTAVGKLAVAFTWLGIAALISQSALAQSREAENARVRIGEAAPDFELPKLTITSDATGKSIGVIRENETIRLSSFRGKRPVCLIMSSYT